MALMRARRRSAAPRHSAERTVTLLFASDLHGSDMAFRKMLNAIAAYKVDSVICGGDLVGKRLYPVVEHGDGTFTIEVTGRDTRLRDGPELAEARRRIADRGGYTVDVTPEELGHLKGDPESVERILGGCAQERLMAWIALANERLAGTGARLYMTGGNDDSEDVLSPLTAPEHGRVVPCDGRVVDVHGYEMASLGWSNRTPWNTPREVDEDALAAIISQLVEGIEHYEDAIFNFHVPPKDSTLDTCPRLDATASPPRVVMRGGEVEMFGAGSTAVSDAIAHWQPMLSLHGHIHESPNVVKLGRTVAINPGSDYQDGALRGAIVALRGSKVVSYQLTRG